DKQSTALKQALEHVEHLSDLKAIRGGFIPVSNALIAMAQSFGPMESTYYVQHCPMADSNKGADWLSTQKEIMNPYFGQDMLTCGETTKTLK
ncbi:MAG: DUF3347 domain-containing protein, partial [Bacteroidota bacterium]|nr:DUF3347 domain-containing protein [Bacteroidota bacterium]